MLGPPRGRQFCSAYRLYSLSLARRESRKAAEGSRAIGAFGLRLPYVCSVLSQRKDSYAHPVGSPCNFCNTLQTKNGSVNAASTALTETNPEMNSMHLFSLKYSPEIFSKSVRDTWQWKDEVLGNGVDYFVPRPKTLAALQLFIQKSSSAWDLDLQEVVVLSNCARFEILVMTNNVPTAQMSTDNDTNKTTHGKAVLRSLAYMIALQLNAFEKQQLPKIPVSFDWPGAIDMNACTMSPEIEQAAAELSNLSYWTHLQGERDILEHLCLVASGMAVRPRRLKRPVVFRPFSSRDAHILLQLKRALGISTKTCPQISLLLRYALQAGKSVRNADKVPEILELRQFGTGNTKYDTEPPADLLSRVTQAAHKKAIEPILQEALEQKLALENSLSITWLRQNALETAISDQDRKLIQKRLHEPTLKLRKGEYVDETAILQSIENELLHERQR